MPLESDFEILYHIENHDLKSKIRLSIFLKMIKFYLSSASYDHYVIYICEEEKSNIDQQNNSEELVEIEQYP